MKLMEAIYARYLLDSNMTTLFTLWDTEAPPKTKYPYIIYSLSVDDFDFNMMQEFEDCIILFDLYSDEKSPAQLEEMFDVLKGIPAAGTGFDFYDLPVDNFQTIVMKREEVTKTREECIWHYAITYKILLEYTGVGAGSRFCSNFYNLLSIY